MAIHRITNSRELRETADEAGRLLQLIQDFCAANSKVWREVPDAKIRFPRGYIRTASSQRKRLSFVRDRHLKNNLAYTLILSDAVLWLSLRTDIWGMPLEMLTKLYAFIIGSLCESITKDYLKGTCGKNFAGRTKWLEEHEVITSELREDLDWLWDIRNRMHLFQLDGTEYVNDYDITCHNRCVLAFRGLLASLSSCPESHGS